MPTLFQINECLNLSTGNIAQKCADMALAKGWKTYLAFSSREPLVPSKSEIIKVGNAVDPYIHYAVNFLFDREGLSSRCATKRLIQKIKKTQPDIVHLHSLHDHWLNYKLLFEYLNQADIKVVWTFHDFWPITGHCVHFVTKNCERWKTECHDCPMQKEYPYSLIDRSKQNWELKKQLFTANKNLTIVPVSQWVGDIAKQSFLKDKPIHVINNGVDLNVFKPTLVENLNSKEFRDRVGNLDDKFIIMAVASEWKNGKGFDDFIAMSKMLKEDEIIVLVGLTENVINTLPANIIGIKRTANVQELAALYTRADVICSFSEAETFGLTIVEGYACGTPAVVYDNTAPPSLITLATGFVVPDKDYKAAYEAIQTIKQNGKAHYSEACIKLAHEKYDKDKCFEEYVRLYEELVKK